ncbi:MAG: O-antigen ligase family protein [Pseudolabrys sp.]
MNSLIALRNTHRARLELWADGLAAAVVVSLPWSTSATGILIVLWLLAVLPTLDGAAVRREVMTPAGGLPVALWCLAAFGMLWADVDWAARLAGLKSYHRLLLIPVLLAQFRRSPNVHWLIYGFLASCVALLAASIVHAVTPSLHRFGGNSGVPVKDYISQTTWFTLAVFGTLYFAFEPTEPKPRRLLWALLAAAFLADIIFVVSSRTTYVTLPILALLFGIWRFGLRGVAGAAVAIVLVSGAAWFSSDYMRTRIGNIVAEAQRDRHDPRVSSAGERLEFWKKSVGFVAEAPAIGHGTGSIRAQFARTAQGQTGAAAMVADNPHQQTLAVAIQLGAVGAVLLWAMWLAHLWLFRSGSYVAWLGMAVTAQNVIGSLFNTHLFDFSQGWVYVFGVGALGGAVLRSRSGGQSG